MYMRGAQIEKVLVSYTMTLDVIFLRFAMWMGIQ